MASFRKFTKRFFIIANIIAVIVFFLACLTAYLNPDTYWYIALLGVGFIFIAIVVLAFLIFWLFLKSKWAYLSLGALVIGLFQLHALFAFHPFTTFTLQKEPNSFRVLTWNVARFTEMRKFHKDAEPSNRLKMFDFIKKQDADVICMQEFFESRTLEDFDENIPYFKKEMNYPYHYFAVDHVPWNNAYAHGVAIFSRFPILDTFRLRFPGPDSLKGSESLIKATLDIHGKKVNIFTTHLQSFLFSGKDYRNLKTIKRADDTDSVVEAGKGIIAKFKRAYDFRSDQAEIVRDILDKSEYPEIITGDFNDVPNSYTYFTIKGDRRDAYLSKGFGLGRTFVFISPTLRIDYILANTKLEVLQCKKVKLRLSDHFPVIADFKIPEDDK